MSSFHRLQLLFLITLLGYIYPALALPASITNDTVTAPTVETPLRFQSEPRGRGTVGILISCSATYIFCVWTTLHPNIIPKSTSGSRLRYKLVLMVLAILVPEGLLVYAFGQWREAKRLEKAWREKAPQGFKEQLGMTGAFFVVMGGFFARTAENPEGLDESKLHTAILTPTGFLWYLERGNIVPASFDKRAIIDKGKSSRFAKVLACSQALWLIVQSTARFASNLPITLLEVQVLIQVACTFFIYWWWFYKLLDVEEPVEITLVPVSDAQLSPNLENQADFDEAVAKSMIYRTDNKFVIKRPPADNGAVIGKGFSDVLSYIYSNPTEPVSDPAEPISDPAESRSTQTPKYLSDSVLTMIVEGGLVVAVGGLHLAALKIHFPTPLESYLWIGCSMGVIIFPLVVVIITSFTRYERDLAKVLWELNMIGIRDHSVGPYAFSEIHKICTKHAKDKVEDRVGTEQEGIIRANYKFLVFCHYFLIWSCLLSLLLYVFSTMYFVVESYISIRNPPHGAFDTPRWGDFWPHV